VIISEPSNPWMAGLAALFTREFFVLAKDRLTDEGVFVQWMHAYQMDWETFALVGRTFAGVFHNSLLLVTKPSGGGTDYLLVGFKGHNRLNLAYADSKRADVQKSKNVVLTDPRLLYRMILSQNLPQLFGPGEIHTDDRPRLEFTAPKLMYSDSRQIDIYGKIRDHRWSGLAADTIDVIRQVAEDTDSQIDFAAYALSLHSPFRAMADTDRATADQKKRFYQLMEDYCAENELDFSIFSDSELEQRCLTAQVDALVKKMDRLPDPLLSFGYLGTLYNLKGRPAEARKYYDKATEFGPLSAKMHSNLGVALFAQGRLDQAAHHFSEAMQVDPEYPRSYLNLGHLRAKQGRLDEAIRHFQLALQLNPDFAGAHNNLGIALARRGLLEDAAGHFQAALRIDTGFVSAHNNLNKILALRPD